MPKRKRQRAIKQEGDLAITNKRLPLGASTVIARMETEEAQ